MNSTSLSNLLNYGSDSDLDNDDSESEGQQHHPVVPVPDKIPGSVSRKSEMDKKSETDECVRPLVNEDKMIPCKRLKLSDDHNGKELHTSGGNVFKEKDSKSSALPMPSEVLKMFSDRVEENFDDSTLHNGRIRSFPHVRGNWASYLYLPCPLQSPVIEALFSVIEDARGHFNDHPPIHIVEDLHLSVSRTVSFRHHWIDSFVSNLKKSLSDFRRIDLIFDKFVAYTNDEKSRTFVSIKAITTEALLKLVEVCDICLADFQLEAYYKDPSFHISCGWMLEDKKLWAENNLIPYLNQKWNKILEDDTHLQCLRINCIEFKTGKRLFRIPFTT